MSISCFPIFSNKWKKVTKFTKQTKSPEFLQIHEQSAYTNYFRYLNEFYKVETFKFDK